jgi:transposase
MADARMPDEFFEEIEPFLPPAQSIGPQGGRPLIEHQIVMKVIWFVLVTGCRWEDVPTEMGCSGRTAHRRLQEWELMGIWDRIHGHLLKCLRRAGELEHETVVIDSVILRAFGGGEKTGPSPVDRRKSGTKHTLLVDAQGVPLGIQTSSANTSDHRQILSTVLLKFPHVGGSPGRPKQRPDDVYADAGYDSDWTRSILKWIGIEPHIRKRGTDDDHLGKIRWVVERTISWLKGLRRMRVRYDRLISIQHAWNTLAIAIICYRIATEANAL